MKKKRQTSITDLAKELGLSASTVSRALRHHPAISEHTTNRVLELAERLKYQPNRLALGLLHDTTGVIGVVVPEITGYFFATVISGVQDMVSEAGYKLLIYQTNESFEEERELLLDMAALRLDGVLISPSHETKDYQHFEQLRNAGIPLVIFDRDCPNFEADKVLVDSYTGAYEAVDYLISSGSKRIVHIAGPISFPTFKQRLDGYLDAHYENNLRINSELIIRSDDFSAEAGFNAIDRLFATQQVFDAIFAVNDAVAIGALHNLRERGYAIPHDIAVIGFDDEPYAQHFYPTLSTVWQPAYELGMLSAKILLDYFSKEGAPNAYRCEVMKPELVIRESSSRKLTPS
ncbi:LacI family transcriptional regulator [Sphingobacterium sp. lm-10]|uniref:LacI family DNA-binding transcriptional regulator n=1 Tax=Sphingobacterium sp. lm-10 TaxID=2944904 RepID=UPI0020225ACA|nr:LacI family transcriptional regulator [Sphingobacterium sp. lm-10]